MLNINPILLLKGLTKIISVFIFGLCKPIDNVVLGYFTVDTFLVSMKVIGKDIANTFLAIKNQNFLPILFLYYIGFNDMP